MDEDVPERRGPARWLAWAVAGLLVGAAVSAGAVTARHERADDRIVTAAGGTAGEVDVPTTVPDTTLPPPATTVAPTTTTTSSTQPPRTTTTVKRTTTSTTAKPAANAVTVTVVNDYSRAVTVTFNGHSFGEVAPGQQAGPVVVAADPNGNDSASVRVVGAPGCGAGDAGGLIPGPGRYRMTIVASPNNCLEDPAHPFPGPTFRFQPA